MHPSIARWPSAEFYCDMLRNGDNVSGLDRVGGFPWPKMYRIVFIDVEGLESSCASSFTNFAEAQMVKTIVASLLGTGGIREENLGIVTPYDGQRRSLQEIMPTNIEIASIDAFQGREK